MTIRTGPTNPITLDIIRKLKKESTKTKAKIWKDVAERLEKPTRIRAAVNISTIEKYLNDGETALIPGKILGNGKVTKSLTISALSISDSAKEKITKAGGKIITIEELIKKNPKGSKVRIMA